ncbi:MAG: DJ-1/PfpI family protein [Sneathiella sp.]
MKRLLFVIGCLLGLSTLMVRAEDAASHDMSAMPESWSRPVEIAMVVYPGFTALDLAGPQYMFGNIMGAKVHIVSKTMEPVTSDTGLTIVPTATYDQVPADIDVLFVPGGALSTIAAIRDPDLVEFVRDRGSRARYVTSVCTGSLVLGAAGLLEGYKATSHWLTMDVLPSFGASPVKQRVVRDRNRITGGGVTAGIDFGLTVVAELRDETYAQALQLLAEYSPEPPFQAGTPETASPMIVKMLEDMFVGFDDMARDAIQQARQRTVQKAD